MIQNKANNIKNNKIKLVLIKLIKPQLNILKKQGKNNFIFLFKIKAIFKNFMFLKIKYNYLNNVLNFKNLKQHKDSSFYLNTFSNNFLTTLIQKPHFRKSNIFVCSYIKLFKQHLVIKKFFLCNSAKRGLNLVLNNLSKSLHSPNFFYLQSNLVFFKNKINFDYSSLKKNKIIDLKHIFYPFLSKKVNFLSFSISNKVIKINFFKNKKAKLSFYKVLNLNSFIKIVNNDLRTNFNFLSINFFSNKYLINYANNFDFIFNSMKNKNSKTENKYFSNYYPIFFFSQKIDSFFLNKFKKNANINYTFFTNKLIINFFELLFNKKVFIKISNNNFKKIRNFYLELLLNDYKKYKPQYFKDFSFSDFINILWYSFLLRDLKILSNWISLFMETLNFKNHKKFVNFFQNFLIKYSNMFMGVLGVRGFFFDIRGKLGVTGSSKKRHLCFKFGSIKKSSKNFKMDFSQNLVRTYSGVMGLTYILCY